MLYRKFSKVLQKWYETEHKLALLVDGARQVGKTTLIRQFAAEHYGTKNFIEINFFTTPSAKGIFAGDLDADTILKGISAYANMPMTGRRMLIFFDEVQECPEVRTAIKFLVDDGRHDYIESGSLLGVMYGNVKSIPVGYEITERMYPMDFEEFAIANGLQPEILEYLKRCYDTLTPVSEFVHGQLMKMFADYVCVGGMPGVVQRYVNTKDLAEATLLKDKILEQFRKDIIKYSPDNKDTVLEIFDHIPEQLDSKNKRYMISDLNMGSHIERYASKFNWLTDAGVALPCYNVKEPKAPLQFNQSRNLFKFFLADTGLLVAMDKGRNVLYEIQIGNTGINEGGIMENMFAQQLVSNGFDLHYYNSKTHGELDFVVTQPDGVVPLEIKSGSYYKAHKALNNVLAVEEYHIKKGIVFCRGNVSRDENDERIIYLPLYMIMFFTKQDRLSEIVHEDIAGNLAQYLDEIHKSGESL